MMSLWPSRLIPVVFVAAVFRPGSLTETGDDVVVVPFSDIADPALILISVPVEATSVSARRSTASVAARKETAKISI